MKTSLPSHDSSRRHGFTLIEVSLVIAVLLSLTSILFLGASVYLRGADRAMCLQNISTMQKAVRSFGNINGMVPGTYVENLKDKLIGPDQFVPTLPSCPNGGLYTFAGNTLPHVGDLYLSCSREGHVPKDHASW